MSKFPNGCFPGFSQFCMEKKEFAVEMKRLYDFPWFLMQFDVFRPFDVVSIYNKRNFIGIYMFKVDNKITRTRYEACLKLKLEINTPQQYCQTVFCCFSC